MVPKGITKIAGLAVLLFGIAIAPTAWAQAIAPQPNAGAIQNQMNRQQQRLQQQQPEVPSGPPITGGQQVPAPPITGPGPSFHLNGIQFNESAFLSKDELSKITAPYVGHEVNFADLQKIVAAINELYKQKEIITASAVLPPQRIENGVVKIDLVEGKLGQARVEGNTYTNGDYITDRMPLETGKTVNVPALKDSIIYFNRTNDMQVRAALQPGAAFGQTDVQLAVQEPQQNTLDVFYDNEGVDSTGQNELGFFFRRIGTLGIDDRLTAYMTGAPESASINGSVSYNLPIDEEGDRIGASYTRDYIQVIQGPFKSLAITGRSQTGALNFSHPFLAREDWVLLGNASASETVTNTFTTDVQTTYDTVQKGTWGLSLTHTGEGHAITVSQDVSYAHAHDGILATVDDFFLYNGSLNAYVNLIQGFTGTIYMGWQYTDEASLPADQLFQIGGPTTVRGYEADVLSGTRGYYLQMELHHNLKPIAEQLQDVDGYGFIDNGTVFNRFPAQKGMTSIGMGFNWNFRQLTTAQFSFGFPFDKIVEGQDRFRIYARLIWHVL